jgi:hypothetical protein
MSVIPTMEGSVKQKIMFQADLGKKQDLIFKMTRVKGLEV